ncbi:Transposon Tf2-9 polyprotein [Thelohanellus kitauei]|uniref:Transposon Tf2-9 polyprotein n=1 Tax=Thelohanellus kitauei TaxID=669202 RepID=A0A0C2JR43_THEKT|nr:Transposon Tf2-9 polyprotein [Thelohanellus kitauei]
MDRILDSSEHCQAYLDDIIIFSKDFDSHLKHITETLSVLSKEGVRLNLKKCKLCCTSVSYLGYEISGKRLSSLPTSIKPILNWSKPTNQDELRRFLGVCNFYCRFIKNFAAISGKLYDLLRKDIPWIWDEVCEQSFSALKKHLANLPTLGFPNYNHNFRLACDASDLAVGAQLSQIINGEEILIAFTSQKLNSAQRKYATIDKEFLSLILAVKKFRHYLNDSKYTLVTDHQPLMHIKTMKDLKGRRAQWLMNLENYDYDIEYIPGKTNSIADALSRSVSAVSLQLDVDISKSQSQDPETMKIIENIKNLQPSTYQIVNGIVFHLCRNGTVLYIPKQLRTTVLEYAHDIIGHQGYSKTLNFLRKRCYWPNMSDDLDLDTKDCLSCISNKYKNFTPKASLQPMTPSNRFSFWEVDFIGPLPLTDDGNKYIIIFIDTYSKWVEAEAIPDQTALTAANALIKCVVSRFGIPDHLHSDKGTQFESEIFQNLCETLNIKKISDHTISPYGKWWG